MSESDLKSTTSSAADFEAAQAKNRERNGIGRRWTMYVCRECLGGPCDEPDTLRECDCPNHPDPDYDYQAMDVAIIVERVQ